MGEIIDNPLVSIVVPIYNMGSKLEKCVLSLLKQTYKNIEIILVDDGSKDNSLIVCNSLSRLDNRIFVYHTENLGSGPARNNGIVHSNGKYIYFPDADDILDEKAIEILVNNAEINKSDVIVFGYKSLDINGKIVSEKKYKNKIIKGIDARNNYLDFSTNERPYTIQGAPWNKFFKTDMIKINHIEYPSLRRHQDEAFIARYITHLNNIQFIDNVLYSYFENNLGKQWDKYPVTYIDDVIGLFNDRKKNMLLWCKNDFSLHDQIYAGHIARVIKALELSFSPKFSFSKFERLLWMINSINKSEIKTIPVPKNLGKYQNFALKLIKSNKIEKLYLFLQIKVLTEKCGLLRIIKKCWEN